MQGSDLIVMDPGTGAKLSMGNVSEFAFDKHGKWLAWIVDAQDKLGNGVQLRAMSGGSVMVLDSAPEVYKGLSWTEIGDRLAVLKGTEDMHWEDKLYSFVAFNNFRDGAAPDKFSFDPAKDSSFPVGMAISGERHPARMAD